ncbi:hypothetical protein BC835DRAFT_1379942 [Cytidiella melzeri]|nr:hypothetical protein BC835DRAFT_1379942 [Cytidiella melzeri]
MQIFTSLYVLAAGVASTFYVLTVSATPCCSTGFRNLAHSYDKQNSLDGTQGTGTFHQFSPRVFKLEEQELPYMPWRTTTIDLLDEAAEILKHVEGPDYLELMEKTYKGMLNAWPNDFAENVEEKAMEYILHRVLAHDDDGSQTDFDKGPSLKKQLADGFFWRWVDRKWVGFHVVQK